MLPESSQSSVEESNHNKVPKQGGLIFVGDRDMSDSDGSSTTIHLGSPYHQIFTSNLCDSTDEAELSDGIGVAGASRLARPTRTIATALREMRELIEENPLQSRCLEKLVAGVGSLIHEIEELAKRGDGQTCHKNSLENLIQGIHETKGRLQLKENANVSLDKENQALLEQNDQLKGENKELLARKNKLETLLTRANAKVEEPSWKLEDGEDGLLKQERNEFNNEYKHISRSEEIKDLGIQTEDTGALQERAELNNYRRKVVKLKEKLDIANADNEQLTSSNSFLEEKIKQLEEKLRLEDSQPNSTEKTIFDEIKEADQQQMGILQMEIKCERNSEATVPIENEELSNATQDFAKNTSELAGLTEELKGTKAQLAEKDREMNDAEQKVSRLEQKLNDTQERLTEKASKVDQLVGEKSQLEEKLNNVQQGLAEKNNELESANQKVLQLEQEQDSAQRELAAKTKELNGKNEKFLEASTHGKRQGNYASISFVLSGAFAVGASLTIPYLAICVTLAVAASIFLAVGCYCSYKANIALSNVEVKNGVDSAAMKV